jgi:putative transposase
MQEIAQLSEASRELAMARLRMLEPHIHEGCALRPIALEAGVTLRTAQRWMALYQAHGLAGLARKGRGDKGARGQGRAARGVAQDTRGD